MITKILRLDKISYWPEEDFNEIYKLKRGFKYGFKMTSHYQFGGKPFKYLSDIHIDEDLFRFVNDPFKFSELFYTYRISNIFTVKKCRNSILKLNKLAASMAIQGIHIVDRRDDEDDCKDDEVNEEYYWR